MWRVNINKAIREIRFVLHPTPEHHQVWHYWKNQIPLLKALNTNTFMTVVELAPIFTTKSAVHFVFGDSEDNEHQVETANLTAAEFEKILKEKIIFGLSLDRIEYKNNDDRDLPMEIVHAASYSVVGDDSF